MASVLLLFISSLLNAQENYQETGMRWTIGKLTQSGPSGLTYTGDDGVKNRLDLLDDDIGSSPGLCGFWHHVYAYNRLMLCTGLELGTRNLSALLADSSYRYGDQKRRLSVFRTVACVPLEAGILAYKSRRSKFRLYTSLGVFSELTVFKKVEEGNPQLTGFLSKYFQDNQVNFIPFLRVRARCTNKMGVAYSFGCLSKQLGSARINFIEHGFTLIFNN